MEPFGPTFKLLRQEKGYSLKEVAHGLISVPTLSKFENGHTDIKLSNFVMLVNRLHLTYDEFMHYHQDPAVLDVNEIISEFTLTTGNAHSRMLHRQISEKYLNYYKAYGIEAHLYASIVFDLYSSTESINDESKKNQISSYLNKCESWGKFELFLFNSLSFIFSIEEIRHLEPFFLSQATKYPKFISIDMHEIIINQAISYIYNEAFDDAERTIQKFYDAPPIEDVLRVVLFRFADYVTGLIKLGRGDASGRDLCNALLNSLDEYPIFSNASNQLIVWMDRCIDVAKKNKASKTK